MKIQLIHPPADEKYNCLEAKWLKSAPIGLELIASALPKSCVVEIIDGNNMSLQEILERIDGGYVGVSDWYSKHDNALKILERAKKKGAITIIGGPNATHLSDRILRNHSFVDYVVVGDGEEALRRIVSGENSQTISNLVYRANDEIRRNVVNNVNLNRIFTIEHILNPDYNRKNPFPLSSIRGCIKAEKYGRCSFCSIEHRLKLMSPKSVWEQISLLKDRYGFEYFFETGDSFVVGIFPELLLESRPDHLKKIKFRIYASPDQINEPVVETLKKLNVKEIFLGVESIDENILEQAGKRYYKNQIDKALSLINKAGISAQVPFIYGLPEESQKSMKNTFEYARQIVHKFPGIKMLVSMPIPLIGSRLFEELRADKIVKREYDGDLDWDDSFDYESLIKLQTKFRTSVKYENICEYVTKTRALVGERNVAGFGDLKRDLTIGQFIEL